MEKQIITPSDVVKLSREIVEQQRPDIAIVRRIKNVKAHNAAKRANKILAQLGVTRRERRTLGRIQRQFQYDQVQQFHWTPDQQEA